MKPRVKYVKRTIVAFILMIAFTVINFFVVRGKYEARFFVGEDSAKAFSVSLDREGVVEITDTYMRTEQNVYCVKLKAVGKGDANLILHYEEAGEEDLSTKIIVHPSGIIYTGEGISNIGNLNIIRYEIAFIFLVASVNLFISLRKSIKENMYSYRVMYFAGSFVFSFVNFLFWVFYIFMPGSIWEDRLFVIVTQIESTCSRLPLLFFPLVLILSVLLTVSNIALLKNEGFRFQNMLGIALGLVLLVMSVLPFALYYVMYSVTDPISYLTAFTENFFEMIFYAVLSYLECMLVGTLIGTLKAQKFVPKFDRDYIIILGSGLRSDGTVTPLLKSRADRAIRFAKQQKEKTGKDLIFVGSGGQGADEVISEAQAIANYLISQGIDKEKILLEEKSCSTYENMKFSKEVILDHYNKQTAENRDNTGNTSAQKVPAPEFGKDIKVAFSTTDYHVFRSGRFAYKLGMNAQGVGAHTKWYFYINALIREFAANMKAQQNRHIGNIIYIILLIVFILAVSFKFNIF